MMTFLKDTDLAERYGVSRVTIWRWVSSGRFPKPIKLSPACTRWRLSAVEEYESKRERAGA